MGVINEDLKILSDDAATGDSFGQSVVLDGGMILIGAPLTMTMALIQVLLYCGCCNRRTTLQAAS